MLILPLLPAAQSSNDTSAPSGSRLFTDAQLRTVGIGGQTIRIRRQWKDDYVKSRVDQCRRLGKRYTLLVVGGDVADPYHQNHIDSRKTAITRLADLFRDDPLLWGVHAGLPPAGHSEELFGKPMSPSTIDKNQQFIKFTGGLFPSRVVIITAGSGNDPSAMRQIIRYAHATLGPRFLYKNNALSAKADATWISHQLVIEAMKLGARGGFELLGGSNESRFRKTVDARLPTGKLYAKAMATVAEIERLAGKKIDYLAPYRYDISIAGQYA